MSVPPLVVPESEVALSRSVVKSQTSGGGATSISAIDQLLLDGLKELSLLPVGP